MIPRDWLAMKAAFAYSSIDLIPRARDPKDSRIINITTLMT